jgi:hypothetical protein
MESAIVLRDPSVTNATGIGRPERLSKVTPRTRIVWLARILGRSRATGSSDLRIRDVGSNDQVMLVAR